MNGLNGPQGQPVYDSEAFIAGEREWQREQDALLYKRGREAQERFDRVAREKRQHRTERLGYLAMTVGVLGSLAIVAGLIWALVSKNMDSDVAENTACYESGGTMSVVNGARVCVERTSVDEAPR